MTEPRQAIDLRTGDRIPTSRYPFAIVSSIATDAASGLIVVTVTHTSGADEEVHSFGPWDPVFLPRREPYASFDWRTAATPPKLHELFVGDKLPSPTGHLVGDDDFTAHQTVRSIRYVDKMSMPGIVFVCDVTAVHPTGTRRYRFSSIEDITFPRKQVAFNRQNNAGEVIWFGPYRNKITGCLWEFTEHPTGRGRWPVGIDPYNPYAQPTDDGAPRKARFPKYDWDPSLEPLEKSLPKGIVKRGPNKSANAVAFGGEKEEKIVQVTKNDKGFPTSF